MKNLTKKNVFHHRLTSGNLAIWCFCFVLLLIDFRLVYVYFVQCSLDIGQEYVDVIDLSQKVIFLLTQEMLTQDWVIYALDVALAAHRKIIVIEREQIDFESLIGSRLSCIKHSSYLQLFIFFNTYKCLNNVTTLSAMLFLSLV